MYISIGIILLVALFMIGIFEKYRALVKVIERYREENKEHYNKVQEEYRYIENDLSEVKYNTGKHMDHTNRAAYYEGIRFALLSLAERNTKINNADDYYNFMEELSHDKCFKYKKEYTVQHNNEMELKLEEKSYE